MTALSDNPEWVEKQWDREAAEKLATRSLIIQHRMKYNYFIMGLATASVAFAFHQSKDAYWAAIMWVWLGAVISWVVSVILGLIYEHNGIFRHVKERSLEESEELKKDQIEGSKFLNNKLFWAQHICLGLGMTCFLIWHILKM